MALMDGLTLYPRHQIRDSRAVMWSYLKTVKPEQDLRFPNILFSPTAWRTMLNWNLLNLLFASMRKRVFDKSLLVCYEGFVRDPERSLRQIGEFIGQDMSGVSQAIAQQHEINIEHVVAGNRTREQRP